MHEKDFENYHKFPKKLPTSMVVVGRCTWKIRIEVRFFSLNFEQYTNLSGT